jgi:hypothetical protein
MRGREPEAKPDLRLLRAGRRSRSPSVQGGAVAPERPIGWEEALLSGPVAEEGIYFRWSGFAGNGGTAVGRGSASPRGEAAFHRPAAPHAETRPVGGPVRRGVRRRATRRRYSPSSGAPWTSRGWR